MRPYEIYNAEFAWNGCVDMRPWVIVEIKGGGKFFGCFPIASQCYQGGCFLIESSHPDFPATGLTKTCNVHDSHIIELPLSAFRKRRGALVGELLKEFRKHTGI